MAGFTSTGFVAKTLEEIRTEIETELRDTIDASLDLSADQPMGQLVSAFAQREAVLWELIEVLAHGTDPRAVEGFQADFLSALTGTTREPAKKSTVKMTLVVTAGFTATAGQIMVNVSGQPSVRFVNVNALGPLSAGTHTDIAFECTEYGPTVANAATITVITAPVSGLTSVTNPNDSVVGSLIEDDASLLARREDELTAAGASTSDAIRADVLAVEGVQQCYVFENVLIDEDATGLPGHAIEVVIYDGSGPDADDLEVATAIFNSKPSGAQTYGTDSEDITDASGVVRTTSFSRATVKNVYLDFDGVVIDPENFPDDGETAIKDAVVAAARARQNLGVDVVSVAMKAAALTVAGVLDVPALKLGFTASPSGTSNLTITGREIASIDTARIEVSTTEGTP